jgi:hypothetical protein
MLHQRAPTPEHARLLARLYLEEGCVDRRHMILVPKHALGNGPPATRQNWRGQGWEH